MNLLPHIFRKDLRHFWLEILLSVALLIAFAWATVYTHAHVENRFIGFAAPSLLTFFVPVSWLVLLGRVLHDESLVGDRQFWITRPYRWPTLLLEKLVFLLAFIHLPLLLMQIFVIHHEGFAIEPCVGHLLQYQLWVTVLFGLPLIAIAVLTPTLTAQLLGTLGGIVYIGAMIALTSYLKQHTINQPWFDGLISNIAIAVLVLIVVLMYARRATNQLRIVLLCLPACLVLLRLAAPETLLVRHAYAAAASGDQFQFDSSPRLQQPSGTPLLLEEKSVLLRFPLHFQSARPNQFASSEGVQVTLQAADGYTWTSAFQDGATNFHDAEAHQLQLYVPLVVYQRLRDQPVRADLHIATETFTTGAGQTYIAPGDGDVRLSDGRRCSLTLTRNTLLCRSPLADPPASEMTFEVQESPCNVLARRAPFTPSNTTMGGGLQPGLDPIVFRSTSLDSADRQGPDGPVTRRARYLCPGAHFQVAPIVPVMHEMLTVSLPSVALPSYALKDERYEGPHAPASPAAGSEQD